MFASLVNMLSGAIFILNLGLMYGALHEPSEFSSRGAAHQFLVLTASAYQPSPTRRKRARPGTLFYLCGRLM